MLNRSLVCVVAVACFLANVQSVHAAVPSTPKKADPCSFSSITDTYQINAVMTDAKADPKVKPVTLSLSAVDGCLAVSELSTETAYVSAVTKQVMPSKDTKLTITPGQLWTGVKYGVTATLLPSGKIRVANHLQEQKLLSLANETVDGMDIQLPSTQSHDETETVDVDNGKAVKLHFADGTCLALTVTKQ